MANGHGGRRPGAGRKPEAIRTVRKLALEKAGPDAERAIAFLVAIMDDPSLPIKIRMAAAIEVIDRVFGKATQHIDKKSSSEVEIVLSFDDSPNTTSSST